jgi:hypothetical protein
VEWRSLTGGARVVQSVLVGIMVPDADHLRTWAAANGVAGTTMAEWVRSPDVQKVVEADMARCAKEGKVRHPLAHTHFPHARTHARTRAHTHTRTHAHMHARTLALALTAHSHPLTRTRISRSLAPSLTHALRFAHLRVATAAPHRAALSR